MRGYNGNPRKITEKQYEALCISLDELGDLSGIVHNIPTDEIIGGNQRMRALSLTDEDIVITEQYDEPTHAGTVAIGYVERSGERFGYRAVVWDAETCKLANLRANHLGGSDDWDILAGWDMETLEAGGFDLELLHVWNEGAENLREMLAADTIYNDGDANSAGGIRPWDTLGQANAGAVVRVVIGEIETVLDSGVYGDLLGMLSSARDARALFEIVIVCGIANAEDCDS